MKLSIKLLIILNILLLTDKFNNLKLQNFASRLKQANLVNKTDFDDKLTSFNKRITSNKTKYLEVKIV